MAKLTLTDIASGYAATATINANNALVEAALENTLSRDGTSPNTMGANLDMNSNRILNLPNAINDNEPLTLGQAGSLTSTSVTLTPTSIGSVLWAQTTEETAAGVTPTYYYYPPGDIRRYGAVGNGTTDDTTNIQRWLDCGHSVLTAEKDKTYKYTSALTVNNNTTLRTNGATFSLGASIASSATIAIGTGVSIDELNVTVATGFTVDRVVNVNDDARINYINVQSVDQQANTGNNLHAAVYLYGDDSKIGKIYTKNFDFGVLVYDCNRVQIDVIETESYVRGVHVRQVDDSSFGFIKNYTASANATQSAGHNGISINECVNLDFGTVSVSDCGEHGVRIGDPTNHGTSHITFGSISVDSPGQSGFKIASPTYVTSQISIGTLFVTDCATGNTTGTNEDVLRLEYVQDFQCGTVTGAITSKTSCAYDGIYINNCNRVHIGQANFTNPVNAAVEIVDVNGQPSSIDIGVLNVYGSAGDGILIDVSTGPSALRRINVHDGYMRDITGDAISITGTSADDPCYFGFKVHTVGGSIYSSGLSSGEGQVIVDVKSIAPIATLFAASDTTPSVKGGTGNNVFRTDTGALTITDFDDGYAGQVITVISRGPITYDVTGTDLSGGTVDIVTAAGDVTQWVNEQGSTWRLIGFMDVSVDNSGGA